ncbi:hypothetical protein CPB86DRAFT_515494 [Serendipita vermifera]|nr:hypothetical protein CPB86DRAFT_515494 [Serendipita vermifera]
MDHQGSVQFDFVDSYSQHLWHLPQWSDTKPFQPLHPPQDVYPYAFSGQILCNQLNQFVESPTRTPSPSQLTYYTEQSPDYLLRIELDVFSENILDERFASTPPYTPRTPADLHPSSDMQPAGALPSGTSLHEESPTSQTISCYFGTYNGVQSPCAQIPHDSSRPPKLTPIERGRNVNGKHYCPVCQSRFARRDRMLTCYNNHLNKRIHRCEGKCGNKHCRMTYASIDCLRRHWWPKDKRQASCEKCGLKTSRQNLARHRKRCPRKDLELV